MHENYVWQPAREVFDPLALKTTNSGNLTVYTYGEWVNAPATRYRVLSSVPLTSRELDVLIEALYPDEREISRGETWTDQGPVTSTQTTVQVPCNFACVNYQCYTVPATDYSPAYQICNCLAFAPTAYCSQVLTYYYRWDHKYPKRYNALKGCEHFALRLPSRVSNFFSLLKIVGEALIKLTPQPVPIKAPVIHGPFTDLHLSALIGNLNAVNSAAFAAQQQLTTQLYRDMMDYGATMVYAGTEYTSWSTLWQKIQNDQAAEDARYISTMQIVGGINITPQPLSTDVPSLNTPGEYHHLVYEGPCTCYGGRWFVFASTRSSGPTKRWVVPIADMPNFKVPIGTTMELPAGAVPAP